jgi:hypothetical protein
MGGKSVRMGKNAASKDIILGILEVANTISNLKDGENVFGVGVVSASKVKRTTLPRL